MIRLDNKKILIATHVYATGPAQDLRDYLISQNVEELLFIGHPLFYDKKLSGSGFEYYRSGKVTKEKYTSIKKEPEIFKYLKDVVLNVYWGIKFGKKWDLYIGSDNLNAFSGIILKWLGRVDRVVYYVIDYNPKRFSNKVQNSLYHWVDQFCVRHADETWNLSPRMEESRKKYFNFTGGKQIVFPIGIWFERVSRVRSEDSQTRKLGFMGHVIEKQGVQYVLDAIPLIRQTIPDFKFLIIGDGNYLPILKEKAKKLGVEDCVQYTGYVKDHDEVEKLLGGCAAAVAMYDKYDKDGNLTFTYFSDPGKLKAYMAAGLPILMTDVSYNIKDIVSSRAGFIVERDANSIASAVVDLMENKDKIKEYQQNAIEYARKYDWILLFENNLERALA